MGEAPTPPRPRARRAPPAVGRRRARLFPPRAAPCAPAPSVISVGPWPPFSRRLCVWLAAWLGSCERSFVRFGNGRVGNRDGEKVCERRVGPPEARPGVGRRPPPRRPLPGPGCRYPPPPHRTHPSRRFPGGSGGETPEKGARGLGRHWGTAGGGPGGQRAAAGDGAGTRSFSPALPPPGAISIRNLGPGPAGAAPGQASVVATERGLRDPGGQGRGAPCLPAVPGRPALRGGGDAGGGSLRRSQVGAAGEGAGSRAAEGGGGRMSHSFVFTGVW